ALETQGIPYKVQNGRILVPVEKQYAVLAQLQRASALPADKKLLLASLQDSQDWMRPRSQLDQRYIIALSNELAQVFRNLPGLPALPGRDRRQRSHLHHADDRAGRGHA